MNVEPVNTFLYGALWMTSWTASVFFLRFWKISRDRLFGFMTAAFALLGLQWFLFGLFTWDTASRHEPYILRLGAFVLILLGIIDKNRRATQAADSPPSR